MTKDTITGAEECQTEATRFLNALFPSDAQYSGKIGICQKPSWSATWFGVTPEGIEKAAEQAVALGTDVYVHCALHDPSKTVKRGCAASATQVTALWADIDLAEAGKDKNYPPGQLALGVLEKMQPNPSIIVDSGNGLHAYWLLNDAVDAQVHAGLPQRFQAYLKEQMVC